MHEVIHDSDRSFAARKSRATRAAARCCLTGLLAISVAYPAASTELVDAELVAGGSAALENDSGTVRLEGARLGRLGSPILVPEPSGAASLGSGITLLALLAGRRRRDFARPARDDPGRIRLHYSDEEMT